MVLDNVDSIEMLFSRRNSQDDIDVLLASYLPKTSNGKILVISRNFRCCREVNRKHI